MTSASKNSPQLSTAAVSCLRDIDDQAKEHMKRRLPAKLVQRSVANSRDLVADLKSGPLFELWTSHIESLEMAENIACHREEHQQTMFTAMAKHALQTFLLCARETEAAATRAARIDPTLPMLRSRVLAAEHETLKLHRRLAQMGRVVPLASHGVRPRPEEFALIIEAERATARAATGQLSALVALWAHDLHQIVDDNNTISDLRLRFCVDMAGLQADVGRHFHLGGMLPYPGDVSSGALHNMACTLFGELFPSHRSMAGRLELGHDLITEIQTKSSALSNFQEESNARLSALQAAVCGEAERTLSGALAHSLNALEEQANLSNRLVAYRADAAAIKSQLTAFAADQLCEIAGLSSQPDEALDTKVPQAGPTLRRA